MIVPILTISSLLSTGVFILLYKREKNKRKDIAVKYQATKEFAEKAGVTILRLQSEKKEIQNALSLANARNQVNTIAVKEGEVKPGTRRQPRRKKVNGTPKVD